MSAAYENGPGETRAFKATHRSDRARRFRAATRHSRWVRNLRIGIPLGVVVGGMVLALVTWFNPLRMLSRLPVSVGDVVVSGTKIKMENPKLSGFTRDSRRYDLTAGAAAQDLTRPGIIELDDLVAVVELQENSTMKLSAMIGLLDTKKELLTLRRDIVVTSSNYEGYFDEAAIDTRTGDVVSEKPMKLKMPNGTIDANRFQLMENGEVIRFEKGVVVNLRMENTPGVGQPGAAR
jgi:lipopolysaccharide export system protein LptC